MALWVRTQDRFELAKISSVYAGYQEKDKDYVIMGEKHNGGARLGSYATKERALEVLDEIEGILMFARLEKVTGSNFINVENNVAIYEMPKK